MSLGGLRAHFDIESMVWIHDEVERYLPAKVLDSFAPGEPGRVRTEDGEDRNLTEEETKDCTECNPEALDSSIADLVNISDLNEMSILHNLRIRYKEDKIYTNISSILISVNPFKLLPLYTPDMLDMYRNGVRDKPPHVFAIAYNSYHNMLSDGKDQSVVISGESGAGKSEATKLILQFLTDVSGKISGHQTEKGQLTSDSLEQQILAANPILEAFGNAKTLRNNNSSRFGKLITVNFDSSGSIIGGNIINYLLEKSRIVFQTKGERNYHIFYQLLSTIEANPQLADSLGLVDPELFEYTNQSGVIHIEGVSDEKDFEDFINSMNILQFSSEERNTILRIVAGVLHFGNVKFDVEHNANAEDGSCITNMDVLKTAARLWDIDADEIANWLTHRKMGARDVIIVSYTVEQAQHARDAMVKRVYAELFQYIVNRINDTLAAGGVNRRNFIGVLDIFGFESFAVNSFEQLCINFCNEKLQFHFNEHIFKMEQNVYAAEGIVIDGTTFVDNQPTLDMLELKTTGIFSMCDEEISVPKGSDEGFLAKVLKAHASHPNMQKPKPKDCIEFSKCFGVVHYAGTVFYQVTNFLEKNKDQLHTDIQGVVRESKTEMLSKMFPPEPAPPPGARRMSMSQTKQKTLGGQFKQQLQDLICTLNATYPHFVRCMKPNDNKAGNDFNASRMQDQLRYAGLVEVCRIRKLGYPVRRPFEEFYKRYKCCEPTADNFQKLVEVLKEQGHLIEGEWAIGHTKIFMRTQQSYQLELVRETAFLKVVVGVQKEARRYVYRRRYLGYLKLLQAVQNAVDMRDTALANGDQESHLVTLSGALEMVFELPWGGAHLEVVKVAKTMLARLKEEIHAGKVLAAALAACEINSLKNAVSHASGLEPPFEPPAYHEAVKMIEKLEAEQEIRNGLLSAMEMKRSWMDPDTIVSNRNEIVSILDRAKSMSYECDETHQAIALLGRLDLEEKQIFKLRELLNSVEAAISEMDKPTMQQSVKDVRDGVEELCDNGIECKEIGEGEKLVDRMNSRIQEMLAAEEAERKRLADEAEKKRLAEEAERKRLAEEEEERKRIAEHEEKMRKKEQEETRLKRALVEAGEGRDIHALNKAIQDALEYGLKSEEVDIATGKRAKLQVYEEVQRKLTAATASIPKLERGVSEGDVNNLESAIQFAESADIPDDWTKEDLNKARKQMESARNYVKVTQEVQAAKESGDRTALRTALDKAENLEMQSEIVLDAKKVFKDAEIAHRDKLAKEDSLPIQDYDHEKAEEARQMRYEIARQARFDYKNYPGLRTAEDFAKGMILSKSKIKDGFLVWNGNVIPKSLTDLPKDSNKVAIQIFKDLLGYMGDKQMPFPAMLAQDILRKGFEYKILRDEIYLQIIKQITLNPRTESQAKGWQMICMCLITFPPSVDFENFLLHFVLEKFEKGRGAVQDYARYCVRSLEGILNSGEGTGFVPSVEEIQAYKERPPILATIELVDGNIIAEDLPITPDFSVKKVLEICTGWLELEDPRSNMFGIYVYDMGETDDNRNRKDEPFGNTAAFGDLPRTPRPLKNDDFMGDVIVQKSRQKRKFKFVMKKKIYLAQHNWRGTDPNYERLIYLQAEDEVIIKGNIPIDDEGLVVELSAISFTVAFGQDFPEDAQSLVECNVVDFILPAWREYRTPQEWALKILELRPKLIVEDTGDLQEKFVNILSEHPLYGTHWFYVFKVNNSPEIVRKLPNELLLGFNSDGMHAYTFDWKPVELFPYADIYRWGGTASQFSLIIWDSKAGESFELIVSTAQAADMAASILDHIRAIMAAEES